MRAIQQFVSDYGVLGITMVVLVVILTVLWILLPLAVYPLYGSVWHCSRELRVLNLTATLDCVAQICPCRIAVLQLQATRESDL